MTVAYTGFHTFRVLNQIMSNLVGLQHDMITNANAWLTMATNQNPDIVTLAKYMHDAATSYETRLSWINNYKNTSPNWTAVTNMFTALGGNITDATTLYTQMKSVADQLLAANITTYAQATTACNQIIAAVPPPDSLWPE